MKKTALLLFTLLLLVFTFSVHAELRTLNVGDQGEDVLALKSRMYALGYFSSLNFSDEYNELTAERIRLLESMNGLEETGIATPELQALIFSDACVWQSPTPRPTPVPTPSPTPMPIIGPVSTPAVPKDETGFLAPGNEEYVYEDEQDGHWLYLSQTLSVEIKRYTDPSVPLVWYETEIYVTGGEQLTSIIPEKRGYYQPSVLASQEKAVLAITDDFYYTRKTDGDTVGIIVRNGQMISDKTYKNNTGAFPNLECLAVFQDGSMKTFHSAEYTAQEYINMGAVNVFAFGPILVENGQPGEHMTSDTYYHYREPRCAMGMIAPNHYLILTVEGRSERSKGIYMNWLAEKMIEKGVVEALNLDGGGTASLVFMGKELYQTSTRAISTLIGFGVSDKVQ